MNGKNSDKDKFENIAKELECGESEDALDKAFDALTLELGKEDKDKESPKD